MSLTKLGLGTNQGPLWHRRPTDFQGTSVSVYWAALKHWYPHIRAFGGFTIGRLVTASRPPKTLSKGSVLIQPLPSKPATAVRRGWILLSECRKSGVRESPDL